MPKSKTQVKKGLDRLMNAPGTSDDIWDDLLGTSDPRKRFLRSLGGARKYDDRAAVLVFQAMVEAHLQLALVKIMKIPKADVHKLFSYDQRDGQGELATFAAKIHKGAVVGLYEKSMVDDLNWIRHIRNVFAHARLHVDFDEEAVRDACNSLTVITNLKRVGLEVGHRNKAWRVSMLTPRQKYTAACAVFTDMLALYLHVPVIDAAIVVRYERMYRKALSVPT